MIECVSMQVSQPLAGERRSWVSVLIFEFVQTLVCHFLSDQVWEAGVMKSVCVSMHLYQPLAGEIWLANVMIS